MSRKEKLAEDWFKKTEHARWYKIGQDGRQMDSHEYEAFLAGYSACEQDAKALVEALEAVAVANCPKHIAHPQSVWWKCWVQDPVIEVLAKWKERL